MSLEVAILIGVVLVAMLCGMILLRTARGDGQLIRTQLEALVTQVGELRAALATGLGGMREEGMAQARSGREELAARLDAFSATLATTIGQIGSAQGERLDGFAKSLSNARIETQSEGKELRTELLTSFETLTGSVGERMTEQARGQTERLDAFAHSLADHRQAADASAARLREEVGNTLTTLGQRLDDSLQGAAKRQADALTAVTGSVKEMAEANDGRGEKLRQSVESRLDAIRSENSAKLEEMRVTVDEKLQGTLEARLGASFSTVNENLERVFKSVGEMQTIATGVGDLKRVLSNVKLRGSFGEASLGMLLEQVMTADQYAENVEVRPGSNCRVEYAIKLPGDGDVPLWLPIDVKLPTEDYERLVQASELGDPAAVEEAVKGLERAIRKCAGDIRDKYVEPPHSTDFGIMFLPTEGLFAEVTRRPGLVDALQRDYRVIVAGPTTLMATLVSLRMGFRSLAIQKRSGEVWQVLAAVKSEFGKFGDMLDKVQKKLGEAQNVVETAGVRRRAVDRQLRKVETLPEAAAQALLAVSTEDLVDEIEQAAE